MRVGFLGVLFSLILEAFVLYSHPTGGITLPGYTATILTVTFFGAFNCLGLGVIGNYVWRAFENTKGRPNFIVSSSIDYPKCLDYDFC